MKVVMNRKKYKFDEEDYFTHNIPVFQEQLQCYVDRQVLFLEIGSMEGRSAVWMLENILTHSESKIICVDCNNRANLRYNLSLWTNKAQFINFASRCIKNFADNTFDFVYIDGSHELSYVLIDGILSLMLVKIGGIIAFDDYFWEEGDQSGVQNAVNIILETYKNNIEILYNHNQIWICKMREVYT